MYSIDETPTRKYDISLNISLLNFEGVGLNNSYMKMLYLVGAVVISIIIISSVFVIGNSFAISITERTRQYGMLSSIGATKKQIRKNVLFEGLILGIIAIPLGILLGIMVNGILALILNVLIKNIYEEINFIYSVPVMAIIASIILSSVTIYLSCLSSARKASRVSPIDAIRSSEDIKIKNKKIKSPKIIKKLFGIGGVIAYKNLKRNKKKYRTTVVSLVVSIMIFISVTSLVQYGFTLSNSTYKELKYNMDFYANSREETRKEQYNKLLEITKLDTVKEYSIQKVVSLQLDLSSLKIKTEAKDYVEKVTSEFLSTTAAGGAGTTGAVQRTYTIGEDQGIKVALTPFISPEGYVTLNVKPEYSTVADQVTTPSESGEGEDLQATLLSRRNLDLKNVRIKDGETLVIGGMIQEDDLKIVRKIPVLGDLPIIGSAFRSTVSTKSKSELVIMITPKIINDNEGAVADI